jgi:hypothetical protein
VKFFKEATMPVISGADLTCSPGGRRAKAAREWFAEHGPADLQPLPLGYDEREALKDKSAAHILALYARSLAELKYDVLKHPSFHDYACGTMASEFQGLDSMKKNPELLKRFPPRHLDGLGPGLSWLPPKEHAEAMEDYRRSKAWAASYAERAKSSAIPEGQNQCCHSVSN